MNRTLISIGRKILQILPDSSFTPISREGSPFDASMSLSFLIVAAVLFFLIILSFYIRHFESAAPNDVTAPISSSAPRRRLRTAPTTAKVGLDASAINSLPVLTYDGADATTDDGCAICLSEFRELETVKVIPFCGHAFHTSCVDTWLASHVTCPMCRSRQLFKGVEEVRVDAMRGNCEIGEASAALHGGAGVRRACSFPDLINRAALERSTSF